ncbi:MAG: hypothetical protein Q8O82_04210 [Pseudorhodobacter sp.]|nr:hypothetical protein [Pseudorhodobacter sp.]
MDFSARVKDLAGRSKHATMHALTEEATKTSVVLPLIQTLGFDVFNLNEVVPEFVADVGLKKGEKVDFALKIDGKLVALVEVKPVTMSQGNRVWVWVVAVKFFDMEFRHRTRRGALFVPNMFSYFAHRFPNAIALHDVAWLGAVQPALSVFCDHERAFGHSYKWPRDLVFLGRR